MKPAFDASNIRRIAVLDFDGPGGPAVTHEFVRQLVGTGVEVTTSKTGADAVLRGTVNPYKPAETLMVYLGNTLQTLPNGQTVSVINPIVSDPSVPVMSSGSVMGLSTVQMVETSARLGVWAQVLDSKNGAVLWSAEWEYEGLDITGLTQTVVSELLRSLGRTVPAARLKS